MPTFFDQELKKIAITTFGSRGDIQPFIAVALGLKSAGYSVQILSCESNSKYAQEFGVSFCPCFADVEKIFKEGPGLEAMTRGDLGLFIQVITENGAKNAQRHILSWCKGMKEFRPDLHLHGTLSDYYALICIYMLSIPSISVKLQHELTNPSRMYYGMPDVGAEKRKEFLEGAIFTPRYNAWKGTFDPVVEKIFGEKCMDYETWDKFVDELNGNGPFPSYVAVSPFLAKVLYPEASQSVTFCGQFIVSAREQEKQAKKTTSTNFGGSDTVRTIENFINSSTVKPIYMGWGSMICQSPEYMVEMLVDALMYSKQRAIVVGGWAKLSIGTLELAIFAKSFVHRANQTSNSEEATQVSAEDKLKLDYASKNVLFVPSAPHEWLFPQCACTITHGGAGTICAALRAGVPTIVTPVFLDQYDHAYLVQQLGCGVGFPRKFQEISAHELGDAIISCLQDSSIATKAMQVSTKLRNEEEGVPCFVTSLEEWWSQYVESGGFGSVVENARPKICNPEDAWCPCQ